jgi:hypothetical protein
MFRIIFNKVVRTIIITTTCNSDICVYVCMYCACTYVLRKCYQKTLISDYADIISLNLNQASSVLKCKPDRPMIFVHTDNNLFVL